MVDFGNSVIIILLSIVILETAIIFGNWINERSSRLEILPMNKDPKSRFYGFRSRDYLAFGMCLFYFFVLLLFVIFVVAPLYFAVRDYMNSAGVLPSLPYISVTLGFIAITVTLIFNGFNYMNSIFSNVTNRIRADKVHMRLNDIECTLQRIEGISQPEKPKNDVNNNHQCNKLSPIFKSIFGMMIFLLITSVSLLILIPNKNNDIIIAITSGAISGLFVLIFQKSILE